MSTTFDWFIDRFMRLSMLAFVFLSGCTTAHALTIGPTVEVKTVIVNPGNPMQVMEQKEITLRVQPVADKSIPPSKVKINIGGWLLITSWDWAVYETRLKALRKIEESSPEMKALVKNAIEEVKKDAGKAENKATSQATGVEFAEPQTYAIVREGTRLKPDTGIWSVK